MPIKLKRKTHPCCEAFEGSNRRNGKSVLLLQLINVRRNAKRKKKGSIPTAD
jgi:hypothetical protein